MVRDGYNVVLHTRLAGHDLTTVTFIDFNLGIVVKDNFLSNKPLENFNEVWREHADTQHTALSRSTGGAHARISEAIEAGPERCHRWSPRTGQQPGRCWSGFCDSCRTAGRVSYARTGRMTIERPWRITS